MSKFLNKDFFGDPYWPQDFSADLNRLPDPEALQPPSAKKHNQNQEPSESSCSNPFPLVISQDQEDFEKSFLVHEQKALFLNFKHEEITYLEDNKKGSQLVPEDFSSEQNLGPSPFADDSHDTKLMKEAELKFDEQLFPEMDQPRSPNESENQSESSMISESEEVYQPPRNRKKGKDTKKDNKDQPKSKEVKIQQNKCKIEQNECKIEEESISEFIEDSIKGKDLARGKQLLINIEKRIMKKLQIDNESDDDSLEGSSKKAKKKVSLFEKVKASKYKILSESEKSFIVYLSTLTTTCEVARRFNISVNNICRWKKGTKRKVGAGRKVVNLGMEAKVIEYVKELTKSGKVFSRRQIQDKAKELSTDPSFKASKGWFERFYSRNIEIFRRSSSYSNR